MNNFSQTELLIDTDKLSSSHSWTSSGLQQQSAQSIGNSQAHIPISNSQTQGPINSNQNNKRVVNLYSVPLTPAQESLLTKGPNFALAPLNPPNVKFISAIESVCQTLSDQDAQGLRAETNCLLRKAKTPKSNMTKEERKMLKELRGDQERIVLTADQGMAMVVLDKKDYVDKVEGLLAQLAYSSINTDFTNKLKAKCIFTLKRIKRETNMGEGMYRPMYPTSCIAPKFYGLPKIHKTGTPLGQLYLLGAQSHMGWLKSLLRYVNPL